MSLLSRRPTRCFSTTCIPLLSGSMKYPLSPPGTQANHAKPRPLSDTSGLHPVGFGAMGLSLEGRPSEQEAIRTIHAALDAGVTLIDTADVYCVKNGDLGHNEKLVAKAVRQWQARHKDEGKQQILIATKGGMERPQGGWTANGSPAHLRKACERSLAALEVPSIDLYYLHTVDQKVPFLESVRELRNLQREGLIKRIGLSNVSLAELISARDMVDVAAVQNRCSLFDAASITSGLVSYCERARILFVAYSPVGGFRNHVRLFQVKEVQTLAEEMGCSLHQLALAYLLNLSASVLPIPGSRNALRSLENAQATSISLSDADLRLLFSLHTQFS